MTDWTQTLDTTYHIEQMGDDKTWSVTGHGPLPFSAMDTAQSLSLIVWIAYVNYLNVRETELDGNPEKKFRLVEWRTKRTKVVVHV